MRLLVTNTLAPQAYAIVHALRPHAERIEVLVEGEGLRAKLAPVCHSRLIDATYRVPSPIDTWLSGRITGDNTPGEAAGFRGRVTVSLDRR